MCNGTEITCTICRREMAALWKTCDVVSFIALNNRVDKSILENKLTVPRAMQPITCTYKKIEKDSHVCDFCLPKERRREERRKNSVARRMFVRLSKALDMITNKKYDKMADENKD